MTLRHLLPVANLLMVPLWWVLSLVRNLPGGSTARPKRVLMVTHNELMARYLREVADLIREDERISLSVARAPFADSVVPLDEIVRRIDLQPIAFWRALTRWWDLVVFADHYPASLFHPRMKKLFTAHGLSTGIIIGGSNYTYGARAVGWSGRPTFSKMFTAGQAEARVAVSLNPVLEETLAFVGSPIVDRLKERARRRAEVRAELGLTPEDRAVMIMSSWGAGSLIQTVGPSIVAAAQELTDRYHFILTIHPNNYTRDREGTDWSEYMARQRGPRFSVVGQYEPWEDHVVAADVAIADRTSMVLYFSQLLRPIVFIPLDLGRFVEEAPLRALYEISPKLDSIDDLEATLERARSTYPAKRREALAKDLVSHPGQALQRMRREILDLLDLPDS